MKKSRLWGGRGGWDRRVKTELSQLGLHAHVKLRPSPEMFLRDLYFESLKGRCILTISNLTAGHQPQPTWCQSPALCTASETNPGSNYISFKLYSQSKWVDYADILWEAELAFAHAQVLMSLRYSSAQTKREANLCLVSLTQVWPQDCVCFPQTATTPVDWP